MLLAAPFLGVVTLAQIGTGTYEEIRDAGERALEDATENYEQGTALCAEGYECDPEMDYCYPV